jgi:hypothetical protein
MNHHLPSLIIIEIPIESHLNPIQAPFFAIVHRYEPLLSTITIINQWKNKY